MQRVDPFYLYTLGYQIHPLSALTEGSGTWLDKVIPLLVAKGALEPLLTNSVYQLKTSSQTGNELVTAIGDLQENIDKQSAAKAESVELQTYDLYPVKEALKRFEAVFSSELALSEVYLVAKKGGLDTNDLINNGQVFFDPLLVRKAPEAVSDARQATKCIAFELPSAAGFHLHRATEAVLRRYFSSVAGSATPPKSKTMGEYLRIMEEKLIGTEKVRSALKDLKNLHRNPLMHPEESIKSVVEAIALLGGVTSVTTHMLADMPELPDDDLRTLLAGVS